jgi:hypothetical protein
LPLFLRACFSIFFFSVSARRASKKARRTLGG